MTESEKARIPPLRSEWQKEKLKFKLKKTEIAKKAAILLAFGSLLLTFAFVFGLTANGQ